MGAQYWHRYRKKNGRVGKKASSGAVRIINVGGQQRRIFIDIIFSKPVPFSYFTQAELDEIHDHKCKVISPGGLPRSEVSGKF